MYSGRELVGGLLEFDPALTKFPQLPTTTQKAIAIMAHWLARSHPDRIA